MQLFGPIVCGFHARNSNVHFQLLTKTLISRWGWNFSKFGILWKKLKILVKTNHSIKYKSQNKYKNRRFCAIDSSFIFYRNFVSKSRKDSVQLILRSYSLQTFVFTTFILYNKILTDLDLKNSKRFCAIDSTLIF